MSSVLKCLLVARCPWLPVPVLRFWAVPEMLGLKFILVILSLGSVLIVSKADSATIWKLVLVRDGTFEPLLVSLPPVTDRIVIQIGLFDKSHPTAVLISSRYQRDLIFVTTYNLLSLNTFLGTCW